MPGSGWLSSYQMDQRQTSRTHTVDSVDTVGAEPVMVWGTKVVVNVNGVVDETAGHSSVVRMIVPLSLQMATKHAPRPSVVL